MYPGSHAQARADQPAIIMAGSGETVTYRELDARSNRLARLLRAAGLKRRDHYACSWKTMHALPSAMSPASGPGSITPTSIRS